MSELQSRVIDDHRSFLFLLGSSRPGGNTEGLARRAAAQLVPGVGRRWVHLGEFPLPPFADRRHVEGAGYGQPVGNERVLLEATLEASDLVVASPLYWYSVSAGTKLYLDYWSEWLRLPEVGFRERMRGRTLWAVSAIGGEDVSKAEPLVGMLRHTAEYMGMRWGGALLGNADRPGDIAQDADALAAAKVFFDPR